MATQDELATRPPLQKPDCATIYFCRLLLTPRTLTKCLLVNCIFASRNDRVAGESDVWSVFRRLKPCALSGLSPQSTHLARQGYVGEAAHGCDASNYKTLYSLVRLRPERLHYSARPPCHQRLGSHLLASFIGTLVPAGPRIPHSATVAPELFVCFVAWFPWIVSRA